MNSTVWCYRNRHIRISQAITLIATEAMADGQQLVKKMHNSQPRKIGFSSFGESFLHVESICYEDPEVAVPFFQTLCCNR
jgi:hypothetical protein